MQEDYGGGCAKEIASHRGVDVERKERPKRCERLGRSSWLLQSVTSPVMF